MSVSRRKITRYVLKVIEQGTENQLESDLLKKCFSDIVTRTEIERKIDDTSTNRIHYLDELNLRSNYGTGYFISAKHHHRPPLINAETLIKRDNPKELTEGEEEKTHFAIGFKAKEAYLLLETKHGGVSIGKLVNYINKHLKQLRGNAQRIMYELIVEGDFLSKVRDMSRVISAEIYTNSNLLTDTFLKDVTMSQEVRHEVELIFKAKKGRSIKATMIRSLYNLFASAEERKISRMKIAGKSSDDDFLLLDTDRLAESEYIEVELDDNGQVITSSIIPKLQTMIASML